MKLKIPDSYLEIFSTPFGSQSSDVLNFITTTTSQNYLKVFISKYQKEITKYSVGIIELFQTFINRKIEFNDCWDVSLGKLEEAIRKPNSYYIETAVALACFFSQKNIGGNWAIKYDFKANIDFDIYSLNTQNIHHIEYNRTSGLLKLNPGNKNLTISFEKNDYTGCYSNTAWRPIDISTSSKIYFSLLDDVTSNLKERFPDSVIRSQNTIDLTKLISSLDQLWQHTSYHQWIERVIKKIIIFCSLDNIQNSGSWIDCPGIINTSINHEPFLISENIVHETSHQYFYILRIIDDISDKEDHDLFYSAAAKKNRPVWAILMAYHAFANVVLLYQELENVIDNKYFQLKRLENIRLLKELELPLLNTRSLTTIGRSLFENLQDKTKNIHL